MRGTDTLFSRQSDEWSTPKDFYNKIDAEFHFTLDPCATEENHKTETYFTIKDNGLSKSWGGYSVFCNPPYSTINEWVRKAYEESFNPDTCVVLLIPARTDTKWFHDYILNRAEVRFIRGRLRFGESKNSAPFPSMLVIFRSARYKVRGGRQMEQEIS